jgi:hypothetical protein
MNNQINITQGHVTQVGNIIFEGQALTLKSCIGVHIPNDAASLVLLVANLHCFPSLPTLEQGFSYPPCKYCITLYNLITLHICSFIYIRSYFFFIGTTAPVGLGLPP